MSVLSSGVFWGVVILLIGLSVILRAVFHIHIPFVRILFGCILIYWGIKMVAGGFNRNWNSDSAIFSDSNMSYNGSQREYNIVFGNGTIDLFKTEFKGSKKIEVNVVFGSGDLVLNDSIPMKVEMTSVFGSCQAPDKSVNALGKTTFTTSAYKEGEPFIFLETNVVFGRLNIENKRW